MDIFTGDKYHLFLLCSDVAYMAPFSCIMRVAYTMIIKVKRYIRILDHKRSLNAFCFRAYSWFAALDYTKHKVTSKMISTLYKLPIKQVDCKCSYHRRERILEHDLFLKDIGYQICEELKSISHGHFWYIWNFLDSQ